MTPSAVLPAPRPYHVLMSMVFSVALAAGWAMLPGEAERVAMLERDGKSKEALALLESSYASGDRSYRTLNHMQTLYEDQGDLAKARTILETMSAEWPRDPVLKNRLANFTRSAGRGDERLAALKAQIGLRYSEAACREYISLLRLSGKNEEEATAIKTCRTKGYRRADDLGRLASLATAAGDIELGASLLKSIDDVRRLRNVDERYQLIALLLDQNQPREAVRRAVRWINVGRDQVLAVGLIDLFARGKYPEAAVDLAKEVGQAGDSISLTVAERLIEQAQMKAANIYLRGWLDNALFEYDDVVTRFIDAAAQVRDPALALTGARKYGLERLPNAASQRLIETLTLAAMNKELVEVMSAGGPHPQATPQSANPSDVNRNTTPVTNSQPRQRTTRTAALEPGDALDSWRRSLWTRLSDDAQKKARNLGIPMPRRGEGVQDSYRSHTKVLKKTSSVLQRTKKLKSLKVKQRLVREGAKARAKKP